jgi:hypothetical protein
MVCQPSWSGCKYTMPVRDTVAGDALTKSSTSNIMVIHCVSRIFWPLVRHNTLLSSNTVFMFSIHTASTGPSKADPLELWFVAVSLAHLHDVGDDSVGPNLGVGVQRTVQLQSSDGLGVQDVASQSGFPISPRALCRAGAPWTCRSRFRPPASARGGPGWCRTTAALC